jgi:glycosyltransferase involved in cell wall biosynthesis
MPRPDEVLVVIPARNEAATVGDVVKKAVTAGYSALVIDDGSTDGTGHIAEDAGAYVVRLALNLGRATRSRGDRGTAARHG